MSAELILSRNEISFMENENAVRRIVSTMEQSAREILVNSEHSFKQASAIWSQARDIKKNVETQRKILGEPERKKVVSINNRAKELTEPLEWIEEHLRSKIEYYHWSLEKERLSFIEKQKEDAEILGVTPDIYVPELPESRRGEGCVTYMQKKRSIQVDDISQVPAKYLSLNTKLIEEDLEAGTHIPGIKIEEIETLQLRSR